MRLCKTLAEKELTNFTVGFKRVKIIPRSKYKHSR